MAVDMFLKLDTIKGESTDAKHKDEIEVLSFSWGVSKSLEPGIKGAPRIADFHIVKNVDSASPLLFEAVCGTGPVGDAVFTVRKAGGDQLEFLKITFKDVIITSVAPAGSTGTDSVPMDQVSLQFDMAKMEVTRQDATGKPVATIVGACASG